jgi:Ca2+-transporting ATPase
LAREYPLSSGLLAMSRAWDVPGSSLRRVAAKGAPEAIAILCRLSSAEQRRIDAATAEMARTGLRVLAVAKAEFSGELPADQKEFPFQFVGLVGLADPLRPSVPEAVQECYRAGIRVVMITGDYPVTAQNIAARAGLRNPNSVVTGGELERLSDSELSRRALPGLMFSPAWFQNRS